MTNEIKPGDLVMVVRPKPCCGLASSMGLVATAEISNPKGNLFCTNCGLVESNPEGYFFLGKGHAHKSRLKKIDPPALDETTEKDLELETT